MRAPRNDSCEFDCQKKNGDKYTLSREKKNYKLTSDFADKPKSATLIIVCYILKNNNDNDDNDTIASIELFNCTYKKTTTNSQTEFEQDCDSNKLLAVRTRMLRAARSLCKIFSR